MNYKEKTYTILRKDATYYLLANILFSISSMLINVCLPKITVRPFFDEFIYIFQMVLFLTNISQIGIILGLYQFIQKNREEALSIYYLSISVISILVLSLGLWQDNPITCALKLGGHTTLEQLTFYASVVTSSIFLYNKGKNVADKDYRYMIRISLTAFVLRMLAVIIIWQCKVSDTALCLLLLFIMPFAQDLWDFFHNSIKYICTQHIHKKFVQDFYTYCLKIWIIASLFTIADRIFMIHTKGLDTNFTTALAFSAGFVGIITLFNNSFYNYFLSNMHENNMPAIQLHIKRLHRIAPFYIIMLIALCIAVSGGILMIYPELGKQTSLICFIVLFRTGLISYLGMYSLLSKVLNMLNLELLLGLLRIVIIWCLCTYWQPSNMVLWYTIITFTVPFPELFLTLTIFYKVNKRMQQITLNR